MRWISAVAASSLLSWTGVSFADESFLLALNGGGIHFRLPSECGQQISCPPVHVDWTGTVSIVTASSADGVYTGDSLLALNVESNQVGFTLDNIRSSFQFFGGPGYSVTLAGDQVVSVDFAVHLTPDFNLPAPTVVTFAGLAARFDVPVSHRLGETFFSASLAPIPEPGSWAMLLAGLATVLAAPAARPWAAGRSLR
jgi:hypothetical protein